MNLKPFAYNEIQKENIVKNVLRYIGLVPYGMKSFTKCMAMCICILHDHVHIHMLVYVYVHVYVHLHVFVNLCIKLHSGRAYKTLKL